MAAVRARESFFVGGRLVSAGDEFDSKDPIVKGRENLFETGEVVEQATAAPGEKRSVARRSPRKKA